MEFLFFHRSLVPLYLQSVMANPTSAHRMHYIFAALDDAAKPLHTTHHEVGDIHLMAFTIIACRRRKATC